MTVAVNSHPLNVLARTADVIAHHFDENREGKPLPLLFVGGAFALVSLGIMLWQGWQIAVQPAGDAHAHIATILFFLIPYFGGWFIFAYGYELYDWNKALRLAIFGGIVGLAAVIILISVAALIAALLKESKGAESSSVGTAGTDAFSGIGSGEGGNVSFDSSYPTGSAYVGRPLAQAIDVALNVAANQVSVPASGLPFSIGTGANVCSQCAQNIDPARVAAANLVAADPANYCPKCHQPYLKAGYGAGRAGS